jgi:hypothetical protein
VNLPRFIRDFDASHFFTTQPLPFAWLQNLSKRIAVTLKEKAASEDKRVIAKLKSQFEAELEKFRGITKTLEQREREILVSMSVDNKGVFG